MPKKIKVLITGADGFIGSHLADQCAITNHEVWEIDNLSRKGTKFNLDYICNKHHKNFTFKQLDLIHGKEFCKILERNV